MPSSLPFPYHSLYFTYIDLLTVSQRSQVHFYVRAFIAVGPQPRKCYHTYPQDSLPLSYFNVLSQCHPVIKVFPDHPRKNILHTDIHIQLSLFPKIIFRIILLITTFHIVYVKFKFTCLLPSRRRHLVDILNV